MVTVFAHIVEVVMFPPRTNALDAQSQYLFSVSNSLENCTFCELTARFRLAKSESGSTVPRKIDLYWFIPALVNSRVGSERGTTEEEGTNGQGVSQLILGPRDIGYFKGRKLPTKCVAMIFEIV
jgi:hypothetical protein